MARYNGGHNAGHTLVVDGKTYKLALLPSGVVRGKLGLIGNGVAVDPEALLAEIGRMQALGVEVTPQTLRVAETATLVLPIHRAIDAAQEGLRAKPIGTTLRGIGPAYEDKVGRRGLRVCGLGEPELLADKLEQLLRHHNAWFRGLDGALRAGADAARAAGPAPRILPFAGPVWHLLDRAHADGRRTVFEGSQAVMLDVDWGSYPFVTSSTTIAAGAATGTGCRRRGSGGCWGSARSTPRGSARTVPHRAGRRTGRTAARARARVRRQHRAPAPRLAGRGAAAAGVRWRASMPGADQDRRAGWLRSDRCVRGLRTRRAAAGSCAGQPGTRSGAPCPSTAARRLGQPTQGVRSLDRLPAQALALVRGIEEIVGVPVDIVTTGPERDDTIVIRDPFGDPFGDPFAG